jgi:hypothetical protein
MWRGPVPSPIAQDVLGRGQRQLVVDAQRGLPVALSVVQHEAALNLYRPAEIDRHLFQIGLVQRDLNLVENLAQRQAQRPVHNNAQRAVLVVLADIGQRAGEHALLRAGHRDQEVVGKIEISHGGIVAASRTVG